MKKKELLTEVISSLLIVLVIGLVFTNSDSINKYKTSNRYFNLLDINMNEVIGAIDELSSSNDNLVKQVEQLTAEVSVLKSNSLGSNNALNKVYPIGSIFISTELSSPTQVHNAIGGTWEVYGTGRVLKSSTGASEQTGGSDTATLTANNLPSHSHTMAHTHTANSKETGSAGAHTHTVTGSCSSAGAHTHTVTGSCSSAGAHTHSCSTNSATTANLRIDDSWMFWFDNAVACGGDNWAFGGGGTRPGYVEIPSFSITSSNAGAHTHSISASKASAKSAGAHTHSISASKASAKSAGAHTHTFSVTSGANNDNTGSTGSGTAFSVLDPYITVYMYKRTA